MVLFALHLAISFALLISSAQVFAKSNGKDNKGLHGGHWDSSSDENEGPKRVQCFHDSTRDLTCEEGQVIEIINTRARNGWRVCNSPSICSKVTSECDGKLTCTLHCNDDDLYKDVNCYKPTLKITYRCVQEPCSNYFCANGGSCVVESQTPTCECLGDWKGDHCNESPCEGFNGCDPGQSCLVDTNDGTRKCCPDEENPCNSVSCQNSGVCLIEYASWTGKCCCAEGFTGDSCETVVTACTDNPCKNSGMCQVDQNGEAQCTCVGDFGGPFCDDDCTAAVTCPPDTQKVSVSGSDRCYFKSTVNAESWLAAQNECKSKGLTLWEPNSEDEKVAVGAILEMGNNYWTGASDMLTEGTTVFAGSGQEFTLSFEDTNTNQKDCVDVRVTSSGTDFYYNRCDVLSRRYVCEQQLPCDVER